MTGRSDGWRASRTGAAPNVGDVPYAAVMSNFAVRLVHGPGWDPSRQIRDQEGWAGHAAFMDGLVGDGFIILGGPVVDGEQTLHAVEAACSATPSTPSRPAPSRSPGAQAAGAAGCRS